MITTSGKQLGYADKILYIKISKSGCFVPAAKEDAVGVAFDSNPYNLEGHSEIADAETVLVREVDGGSVIKAAEEENRMLRAQLTAATDRQDFLEDCIAEMAMQVYSV